MSSSNGICFLIGAGPGDPELITRKGASCLSRADIVFFDQLGTSGLMSLVSDHCETVYVGQQAGDHAVQQDEIISRICSAVRDGLIVVRLKGGDPFVFGRGGEEALALAEAGLDFEVVPGVTSGISVPAYAGIPVTQRGVATSITLVTGHETPDKLGNTINWLALAAIDGTICFYMGVSNLPTIVKQLIDAGKTSKTPIAIISIMAL